MHPDLIEIQSIYNSFDLQYSQSIMEAESFEYGACTFKY